MFRIKTPLNNIKYIAWFQILGGLAGLYTMSMILLQIGEITGPILFIIIFGYALYVFSIYCGRKLLENELQYGTAISVINQLMQVFQWKMFGYGLTYATLLQLNLGYSEADSFKAALLLGANFQMTLHLDKDFMFVINFTPLIIIALLIREYDSIRHRNTGIKSDMDVKDDQHV